MIRKYFFKSISILILLLAVTQQIFCQTKPNKAKIPDNIKEKISKIQATKKSWYIRTSSGSKAGKVVYGPFETNEQALCIWIYENLPEKKNYCIAKNNVYLTDKPLSFYPEAVQVIKSDFDTLGAESTLNKYFLNDDIIALTGQYEKIKQGTVTATEDTYQLTDEQLYAQNDTSSQKQDNSSSKTETENKQKTSSVYKPAGKPGKAEIPGFIKDRLSRIKADKQSFYIRKASGSKAGKIIYGPFNTREQALCIWIFENLPEKSEYCIAKDDKFITSSPMKFYDESQTILNDFSSIGSTETLNKYFCDENTIRQSIDFNEDMLKEEAPAAKNDKKTETKSRNYRPFPPTSYDNTMSLQDYN